MATPDSLDGARFEFYSNSVRINAARFRDINAIHHLVSAAAFQRQERNGERKPKPRKNTTPLSEQDGCGRRVGIRSSGDEGEQRRARIRLDVPRVRLR